MSHPNTASTNFYPPFANQRAAHRSMSDLYHSLAGAPLSSIRCEHNTKKKKLNRIEAFAKNRYFLESNAKKIRNSVEKISETDYSYRNYQPMIPVCWKNLKSTVYRYYVFRFTFENKKIDTGENFLTFNHSWTLLNAGYSVEKMYDCNETEKKNSFTDQTSTENVNHGRAHDYWCKRTSTTRIRVNE